MTRVVAFDVNETLLDLSALDGLFEEVFASAALRPQWFAMMLQVSFVGGLTGSYVDFTTAQRAALRMIARREGVRLPGDAEDRILDGMRHLPAHPEVAAALGALDGSGLEVVALTNSVQDVAEDQLTNAGLRDLVGAVMSADAVGHLKPSPEPYLAVAERYAVPADRVRLVAAHHWDVTGALRAGCAAAFVARPGAVPSAIGPQPDIVEPDLTRVVARILEVDVP